MSENIADIKTEKISNINQLNRLDRRFKINTDYILSDPSAENSFNDDLLIESSANNIHIIVDLSKNIHLYGNTIIEHKLTSINNSDFCNNIIVGNNAFIENLIVNNDVSFLNTADFSSLRLLII